MPQVIRLTALVLVTLIALSAAGGMLWALNNAQAMFGQAIAWIWYGGVGLLAVGCWTWRQRGYPVATQRVLFLGLVALVFSRLLVAVAIDAPLISDFLDYHNLAKGILAGGPWMEVGRPPGFPLLLAAAYGGFGANPAVGEALNVALGVASGGLVYMLVRAWASKRAAAIALLLFALWPAHILMTPVLGTEVAYATVFLALLLAFACLATSAAPNAFQEGQAPRPLAHGVFWAALAALLTALAQYVRPTTLALVPAAILTLWLVLPTWKARLATIATYTTTLLLLLAPVAAFNHREIGHYSLSTSAYGGWSLLVGMNQKHLGMWNMDDAAIADKLGGMQRVDQWARAEGWRRLTTDPVATLSLVCVKFPVMWSMEDFGPYWCLGTTPNPEPRRLALLNLLSQTWYAGIAFAAALALVRRRQWPVAIAFPLLGLLTLAGVHSLLEVQGRYHFYWTPLLLVLAVLGLEAQPQDQPENPI